MPDLAKKIVSTIKSHANPTRLLYLVAVDLAILASLINPVTAAGLTDKYLGSALTSEGIAVAGLVDTKPVFYGPKRPPTVKQVLLDICQEHGYGEDCAKALLGMSWKESNLIGSAVGDSGKALGYFQIHYRRHNITAECARDFRCSAEWTLSYMERNGYPKYPKYAIQCHNGCNAGNGYAAAALRQGERLWKLADAKTGESLRVAMK